MRKPGAAAKPAGYAAGIAKVTEYLAARHPEVRVLREEEVRAHELNTLGYGWQISLRVRDDVRVVDVLVDDRFPFSVPRIALVDPPKLYTWLTCLGIFGPADA
jgi:hypothetical protein